MDHDGSWGGTGCGKQVGLVDIIDDGGPREQDGGKGTSERLGEG